MNKIDQITKNLMSLDEIEKYKKAPFLSLDTEIALLKDNMGRNIDFYDTPLSAILINKDFLDVFLERLKKFENIISDEDYLYLFSKSNSLESNEILFLDKIRKFFGLRGAILNLILENEVVLINNGRNIKDFLEKNYTENENELVEYIINFSKYVSYEEKEEMFKDLWQEWKDLINDKLLNNCIENERDISVIARLISFTGQSISFKDSKSLINMLHKNYLDQSMDKAIKYILSKMPEGVFEEKIVVKEKGVNTLKRVKESNLPIFQRCYSQMLNKKREILLNEKINSLNKNENIKKGFKI